MNFLVTRNLILVLALLALINLHRSMAATTTKTTTPKTIKTEVRLPGGTVIIETVTTDGEVTTNTPAVEPEVKVEEQPEDKAEDKKDKTTEGDGKKTKEVTAPPSSQVGEKREVTLPEYCDSKKYKENCIALKKGDKTMEEFVQLADGLDRVKLQNGMVEKFLQVMLAQREEILKSVLEAPEGDIEQIVKDCFPLPATNETGQKINEQAKRQRELNHADIKVQKGQEFFDSYKKKATEVKQKLDDNEKYLQELVAKEKVETEKAEEIAKLLVEESEKMTAYTKEAMSNYPLLYDKKKGLDVFYKLLLANENSDFSTEEDKNIFADALALWSKAANEKLKRVDGYIASICSNQGEDLFLYYPLVQQFILPDDEVLEQRMVKGVHCLMLVKLGVAKNSYQYEIAEMLDPSKQKEKEEKIEETPAATTADVPFTKGWEVFVKRESDEDWEEVKTQDQHTYKAVLRKPVGEKIPKGTFTWTCLDSNSECDLGEKGETGNSLIFKNHSKKDYRVQVEFLAKDKSVKAKGDIRIKHKEKETKEEKAKNREEKDKNKGDGEEEVDVWEFDRSLLYNDFMNQPGAAPAPLPPNPWRMQGIQPMTY